MSDGVFDASIEGDALDRVLQMAGGAETMLSALIKESSRAVLPHVKDRTPVAHGFTFSGEPVAGGALRHSLQWAMGPMGASLMGYQYGEYVIGGTAPHPIRPRVKQALAFWWAKAGGGVVRKSVQHPGTQPNDFRQTGIQQAFDTMAITDTIDRVVGQWLGGSQT